MKFNQSINPTTEITDFTQTDYLSIINVLYGLNSIDNITFKDNNKYNLSKDNVIITE
tara:strand:- start:294 stop:464 length:171 start_codon:yes stop_codon:yes gene_type:complete